MLELINFLDTHYHLQLESRHWRNQENVARYFKIKHIDAATHKNWLESLKKEKPKDIAFFVKFKGEYIGVAYFHSLDYEHKYGDWGIYLYKENLRGHGLGKQILKQCIIYAKDTLHLDALFLDVLQDNMRAIKSYEANGFTFVGQEENDFLRYKKEL